MSLERGSLRGGRAHRGGQVNARSPSLGRRDAYEALKALSECAPPLPLPFSTIHTSLRSPFGQAKEEGTASTATATLLYCADLAAARKHTNRLAQCGVLSFPATRSHSRQQHDYRPAPSSSFSPQSCFHLKVAPHTLGAAQSLAAACRPGTLLEPESGMGRRVFEGGEG